MLKFSRLILILILLSSTAPGVYAQTDPPRMHPLLLKLAQSRADMMVRVIVQQEAESTVSPQSLSQMGGENTRELPLINGFATEVPARALEELAETPGVKWISPDAPMSSSASFGQDGLITTNIGNSAAAYAITIDPNGKILVAGTTWNGSNDDITLTRYNDDGSLDSTFGNNGFVTTAIGTSDDRGLAVVVQADGKILVAGHIYNNMNFDFGVVRYQSNGAVDTTFGNNGRVITNISGNDFVNGIVLQTDGKILVIGEQQNNYLTLVRYTSAGQLDSTFDGDGILVTTLTIGEWYGNAVALQSDGKLVVTGTKDYGYNRGYDIVVARYTSNGALDPSFDGDGYAVTTLSSGADRGNAIKVQADGKLVVTGIGFNGVDFDLAVLRYNSNGALDTTFDGDGITTTHLGGDDYGFAIAFQPDNKILISGFTYIWNGTAWEGKVALVRYNSNGALDTSFDGDGFTLTQIKAEDNYSFAMTLQSNGKIALAGYVDINGTYSFTTLRYTSSGSLDIGVNPILPAIQADRLRQQYPTLQGTGVTVAVVDSGINNHTDLLATGSSNSRVIGNLDFSHSSNTNDSYGHGTHVAGLIGANGASSAGLRGGVAPNVNLLNLKVSNSLGVSYISDVVASLNWIYQNKNVYNIRVVNLSMNSIIAESYHTNPLDAALEILWFNGIVVVVSAGNNGTGAGAVTLYPPANDPFVITVGATDQVGTSAISDDRVAHFSAYGTTENGYAKPDLVAPGRNMVSLLAGTNATIYTLYPTHRIDGSLFRMSGTSMAAPIVSGAAAVLLQDEPNLTPDQVKYRLKATANKAWTNYNSTKAGAGYLDLYAAVTGTTTQSANTSTPMSQLLFSNTGTTALWDSVSWNSVSWNSVSWNSVSWNSVSWNSTSSPTAVWSSSLWDETAAVAIPVEARTDQMGSLTGIAMAKRDSIGATSTSETVTSPEATATLEESAPMELTTSPETQTTSTIYLPLVTQAGQ